MGSGVQKLQKRYTLERTGCIVLKGTLKIVWCKRGAPGRGEWYKRAHLGEWRDIGDTSILGQCGTF